MPGPFLLRSIHLLEDGNENIPIVSWREIIKTILDFRCITILDVNLPVFINIEFMVSFRMELSDKVLQFFLPIKEYQDSGSAKGTSSSSVTVTVF